LFALSIRIAARVILPALLVSTATASNPAAAEWGTVGSTPCSGAAASGDGEWKEVAPPIRTGHTAVYDPVRDRMLVFGTPYGSPEDVVWALPLSGPPQWSRLTPKGESPGPLLLLKGVYDPLRDRVILFGGSVTDPIGETWALQLGEAPFWTRLDPAGDPPSRRWGHAVAYDPVGDRMIVIGGRTRIEYRNVELNDVWALSLGGQKTWTQLSPCGAPPAARHGHSAVYTPEGRRVIIMGGESNQMEFNDAWALGLDGEPEWSPLPASGSPPSPRYSHSAIYDPERRRMVVFGGYSLAEGGGSSRAWELTLDAVPVWTELIAAGEIPRERAGPSAIYDPIRDRMIVHGGGTIFDCRVPAETWSMTLTSQPSWTRLLPTTGLPDPRRLHSAILDTKHDRMVVFGGIRQSGTSIGEYLNDTWSLPLGEGAAWRSIAPLGTLPPARVAHSAILDPPRERMIVFGGHIRYQAAGDVWALSLDEPPEWTELQPAGPGPGGRSGHSAVLDPVRERMIVFGGEAHYQAFADLWALSLGEPMAWVQVFPEGTGPEARSGHAAVYDPVRDRMIVFGGQRSSGRPSLADAWELSLGEHPAWSKLEPTGEAPGLRAYSSAVYDPARDRLILFGGMGSGQGDFNLNDAWALSLGPGPRWTALPSLGLAHLGRFGHSAIFDPRRDRMRVYAGGFLDPGIGTTEWCDSWDLEFERIAPPSVSLLGARADLTSAVIAWRMSGGARSAMRVHRSSAGMGWRPIGYASAGGSGELHFEDRAVTGGRRYGYRLALLEDDATTQGEVWLEVPSTRRLALRAPRPNPTSRDLVLDFSLPEAGDASIEILDLGGRRVFTRTLGGLEAGTHVLRLGRVSGLEAGMHFVRIRQASASASAKFIVLP